MALSGTLNSSAYDERYIQFSWSATQNIENNTSTISWTLAGAGGSKDIWYKAGGFKIVIDGATVYSTDTSNRIQLYNGTVVATGTRTINHNPDGSRSFNVSISAGIYTYAVNCTGSKTFTLNNIPRASTLTMDTLILGSANTITINRASSSFTHTLTYKWGDKSGTIATKTTSTSVSWTPSLDLANSIPNTSLGQGSIRCDTYNGSTLIGSIEVTFYGKVPDTSDTKPSISVSISEAVEDVKTKIGSYVKDLSKLSITVTASGKYNASIKSYTIKANGSTYNEATAITDQLTDAGTMTVTAIVVDSRGYTGTASVNITVLDYSKPKINGFNASRVDNGSNLSVTYDTSYTSLTGPNGSNEAKAYILYKTKDETEYTRTQLSNLVGSTIFTNVLDINHTYDVLLEISDSFNSTTVATLISTAFTLLDFNASGKSMAIGKISEDPDKCEIALPLKFKGNLLADLIYPVGSIYMSTNSVDPSTIYGGTWERIKGRFLIGADDTYTAGNTGGEATHTLTKDEIPNYSIGLMATVVPSNHDNWSNGGVRATNLGSASNDKPGVQAGTGSNITHGTQYGWNINTNGGGRAHNNLPPYLVVYMWERKA